MRLLMYVLSVKSSLNFAGKRCLRPSMLHSKDHCAPRRWNGFHLLALLAALLLDWTSSAQVVINEIAASNGSSVENGGSFPDWAEFYNISPVTADLLGSSITFSNIDCTNHFNFS